MSGLQRSAGCLQDPTHSVPDLPLLTWEQSQTSGQKKQTFARFFSEREEIPIGSHGPPKLVSNSALFKRHQREQPCKAPGQRWPCSLRWGAASSAGWEYKVRQGKSTPSKEGKSKRRRLDKVKGTGFQLLVSKQRCS